MSISRQVFGSAACAIVMLAAACSSTTPEKQSGKQAAQRARTAVAQEYWQILGTLRHGANASVSEDGSGYFDSCGPNSSSDSAVEYFIQVVVDATSTDQSPPQFSAAIIRRLQGEGWSAFHATRSYSPDERSYLVGQRAGLHASIGQPTNNLRPTTALLQLTGSCVTVGSGLASSLVSSTQARNDTYPVAQAAAKPIPSALPLSVFPVDYSPL